ncbi:MAG: tetratricopeptide repeat protein [Flammeovirgaceae bacterium]|nr:tetratricopeptide repeat protein [Flammeovirgaceae bacterium]
MDSRRLIFWFFITLSIQSVQVSHAQNTDSLTRELLKPLTDSARITILDTLADLSISVDINQAKVYADQIIAIAEQNNLSWALTKGYGQLGLIHSIRGDYLSASKYDNLHLQHVMALKDSLQITVALTNLGDDYLRLGEYEEAYFNFINAYKFARIRKDSSKLDIAILNLGSVFKGLEQYDLALNHIEISKKINEKRKRQIWVCSFFG